MKSSRSCRPNLGETMSHFTRANSDFTADARNALNDAVDILMNERTDEDTTSEDRVEIAKSVGDSLNNAWFEGATIADLLASVRGGH